MDDRALPLHQSFFRDWNATIAPLAARRIVWLTCLAVLSCMPAHGSVTVSGPGAAESGGHWWSVTWINDGKDGGPAALGGNLSWYATGGAAPWGYSFTQYPATCNGSAAGCFQRVTELHGNPFRMWQNDSDAGQTMCFG